MPGVSVLVKGTTAGTTTDTDGRFTLSVPDPANSILVFSFIGFSTQEVGVANRTSFDVNLVEDITQLGEVVVTALGIEREKKALGYSVQQVDGSNFTQARESNIINNLQGRVAGVQIYKGGTGPGGSSKIVIRGSNSLRGADAPLFVVDGVPYDNYATATNTGEYGSFETGQGIAQINPDDVESMTVLKGSEAGALYGNRGANGVILITTKKGTARKGLGVNFNSNLTFDTPLLLPEVQNKYGQGANGVFDINSGSSWGPEITGQTVTDWTGQARPMSADPDDFKNFLQTGQTFTNSIDLSGGNEKATFRLGYTNFDNKGLLPNSTLKRNMVTLRATSMLTDKLSADVKVSYSRQDGKNRPQNSGSPSNIIANYITMPRSIHLEDMKPWKDKDGAMVLWRPTAYSTLRNPYWVMYEDFNQDLTERYLTMVRLEYKFNDWLKAFVRHGMDQRHTLTETGNAYGIRNPGDGTLNFNSGYSANRFRGNETNADFLITATKTISDFNLSLSVGANRRNTVTDNYGTNTNTLFFAGLFSPTVGSNPRPQTNPMNGKTTFRVNSVYAFLNFSFKNFWFADVTYRNDWSSSVSPENRSFGYPSFSTSLVLSDMIDMPSVVSYAKIRGGYASTGNTIDPFSLITTYDIGPGFNNAITATMSNSPITGTRVLFDPNVVPEKVNSFEVGADLKFWENRLGIELAYYNRSTTNQIIPIFTSGATGWPFKIINAGNVTNKGFEFVINASPVRTTSGFSWDIGVNFNRNVNKLEKLIDGTTRFLLQSDVSSRAVRIVADEGEPMGDIYGRDFERDDNGNIVVDANGVPVKGNDKNTFLGNYQPKYTMGIVNTLSYKNLSLGFLIDMRVGGKFYSQSLAYMHQAGTAEGTIPFREGGMIVDGVYGDGSPNTTPITAQQYWSAVAGAEPVASLFIYDATNIRLRELTLSFNFPSAIVNKTPFSKLSIGFVGRNLWLIKSEIPGVDPESSFTTTNAQGWENAAYPSYRSFGFNLNLGF